MKAKQATGPPDDVVRSGSSVVIDTAARPDLCAVSCLQRVQRFIRDEIDRETKKGRSDQAILGMTGLADDVDELVADILRRDEC